jgi:hypothetical protein
LKLPVKDSAKGTVFGKGEQNKKNQRDDKVCRNSSSGKPLPLARLKGEGEAKAFARNQKEI